MKVLVFHGYGSSPTRIRWLIKPFEELGFEVEAPRLPSPLIKAYQSVREMEADLYAGHSMGGALALLKSSEKNKPAIAIAPPTDLKLQMEYMKNNKKLRKIYEEIVATLGGNLELMYEFSPINRTYTSPILIIHGTEDDVVPIEQSLRFCEKVQSCELVKIEGMGHIPREEHKDTISTVIRKFCEKLGKKDDTT